MSKRNFWDVILTGLDVFYPCSQHCHRCLQINSELSRLPIASFWKRLLTLCNDHDHYSGKCDIIKAVREKLHGTVIKMEFCIDCENPNLFSKYSEGTVHQTEIIDCFNIKCGISESRNSCTHHKKKKILFSGFGKVPQLALLEVDNQDTSFNINSQVVIVPLRFLQQNAESSVLYSPCESNLNVRKVYFIPNPMNEASLRCKSMDTEILFSSTLGQKIIFLISIENTYENRYTDWTLSDLINGKALATNNCMHELYRSFYFNTETDFDNPVLIQPNYNLRKNSNGEVQVIDVTEIPRPTFSLPTYTEGQSTSTSDCTLENDRESMDQNSDSDFNLGNDVASPGLVQSRLETLSFKILPPILSASFSDLKILNVSNPMYDAESNNEIDHTTMQQYIQSIKRASLCCPGVFPSEVPSLPYKSSLTYGENANYLDLTVDIDSIDILSTEWGIRAFQGEIFELLPFFKGTMHQKTEYLDENNNFVGIDLDKGFFYSERRSSTGETSNTSGSSIEKPISVTVFYMQATFSAHPIPINAIIPIEVVHALKTTSFDLLKLFQSKVNRGCDHIQDNSIQRLIAQFVWYFITQLFVKMSSLITRKLCFPNFVAIDPCCSIQTTRNSSNHDRSNGPGSGNYKGPTLVREEILATSHLVQLFFIYLEVELGISLENATFSDEFQITPLNQDVIEKLSEVDEETKILLQQREITEGGKEFFRNRIWDGRKIGNLVSLSFDDETVDITHRIPGKESARKALLTGEMKLEQCLMFAPILFRCSSHGLKYGLGSYEHAEKRLRIIQDHFSSLFVMDSIIDIGFTLKSTNEDKCDVLLPASSVLSPNLIFPPPSGRTTHTGVSSRGSSIFSGMGYPYIADISTRKLKPHEDCAPFRYGIRRLKCYSNSRHSKTTRGLSLHETTGKILQLKLSRTSEIFSHWLHQNSRFRSGNVRSKYEKEEKERMKLIKSLVHNSEAREENWKCCNGSIGMRMELTVTFLEMDDALKQEILRLVQISNAIKSISLTQFESEVRKALEDPENISAQNTFSWPWWTDLSTIKKFSNENKVCLLPVALFRNSSFTELEFILERKLLQTALEVYSLGKTIVSGVDKEDFESNTVMELEPLFSNLSHTWVAHLSILITRGLLEAAKALGTAQFCETRNCAWSKPSFLMIALGLEATWYQYGYPNILVSRVLSLHECIRFAAFRAQETENDEGSIFRTIFTSEDYKENEDILQITKNWDFLNGLPERLSFARKRQHPKFDVWVYGVPQDKNSFGISQIRSLRTHNLYSRYGSVFHELSRQVTCHFDISTISLFRDSLQDISIVITLHLIADFFKSLQFMSAQYGHNDVDEDSSINYKMFPSLNYTKIVGLRQDVRRGVPWTENERIISSQSTNTTEAWKELNQYFKIPQECIVKNRTTMLNDGRSNDGHNPLTNADGSISFSKFFKALQFFADSAPSHICNDKERNLVEEGNTSRFHGTWRSIYAFRILFDFVDVEIFEEERSEPNSNMRFINKIFTEEFPSFLWKSLLHAGFCIICPRIMAESELVLDQNSRAIPWHGKPFLSWLRESNMQNCLSLITSHNSGTRFNSRIMGAVGIAASGTERREFLEVGKIIQKFTKTRRNLRVNYQEAERNNDRRHMQSIPKEFYRLQKHLLRNFLRCGIVRVILHFQFHIMSCNMEFGRFPQANHKQSLEYAVRVVENLLHLRLQVEEEGIAVCQKNNGEYISLYNISDENINLARRSFPSKKVVWDKPWSGSIYPNPKLSSTGGRTSKIQMALVNAILFRSGLTFKVKREKDCYERRVYNHLNCTNYKQLKVRELYTRFRDPNQTCCENSTSYWRLSPFSELLQSISQNISLIQHQRITKHPRE